MKKKCLIGMAVLALAAAFCWQAGAQTSTRQDAVDMVEKAGRLITEKGDEALPEISNPRGIFIDRGKALYVFVYDENIVVLAHPYHPELIGQTMKLKADDQGRLFHEAIVRQALTRGSGWTEYTYQKPVAVTEEITYQGQFKKNTYGKLFRHGSRKYIVGSGTYED